ncbi:putative ankyrin repeat protein RF_0381 [Physella acuta]|uniref:putative ankyrin repeat protein RF_0381 n=1 Tax=Physella acuta TaxID=109671 RepID=UPI0027DBB8D0|nr:putative ankyrin repeat protein RF_0381 [Physella acuta]
MLSFLDQQTTATKIFSEDHICNTYPGKEEISSKNYNHFQALLISLIHHSLRFQDVDYLYFFLFVIQAVFLTLTLIRKSRSNICFKNGTISYLAKKCVSIVINNVLSMVNIDLNRTDSDGKAPLHFYAEKNNVCFGELSLIGGADVNVKTTGLLREKSPLYISAENGHKDFVQLLLKWKANVNELNGNEKKSALHVSIERGYVEIVDILLDAGADVNLADGRGETALRYAVRHGSSKLDKMLFKKDTIIRHASNKRETADLTNWTALYTVAVKDSKRLIQLLLDRGADLNSTDNFGTTALHYTSQDGSNEIVDFLLQAGASADIIDNSGQTALHYAVKYAQNPVTALTLLKKTRVFDIGDMYDNTALHYSCRGFLKEFVEALLEAGADVDRRGQFGSTPLHYSVMYKQIETMRLLIQRGATLDIADNNGQTALDVAIMFLNEEAFAVLRQHGAMSSAEIKEKNTSTVVDCSTFTEVKSMTETTSSPSFATPPASTFTPSLSDETTPSNDTAPPMDITPSASTTIPKARDDTTPSTNNAPYKDTTPTAFTTTSNASNDNTPSNDNAPYKDTTTTASTTTPKKSQDTTPSNDTAPYMDTTPKDCITTNTVITTPNKQDTMVRQAKTSIKTVVKIGNRKSTTINHVRLNRSISYHINQININNVDCLAINGNIRTSTKNK